MLHLSRKPLHMPRLTVFFVTYLMFVIVGCQNTSPDHDAGILVIGTDTYPVNPSAMGTVPVEKSYERNPVATHSFADWLRHFPLQMQDTILLYNGSPARYQNWHYAVLELSVDKQGLQQCADAIMRLRAEYFFERHCFDSIRFPSGQGDVFNFAAYAKGTRYRLQGNRIIAVPASAAACNSHECLLRFLQTVFAYCGTYTLQQMTNPVPAFTDVQPGDVLVRGGSPGHAIMVCDVMESKTTHQKKYLLLQGYTPAMQVHIVKNPQNGKAWFTADTTKQILTPGYVFNSHELRRWK